MMTSRPAATSTTITSLLVLLVAIGPISTDLYLPALPGIQAHFGVDVATVQLTLSVYLIAFALCQLIYGPLSDRFGRRPVMLCGMALYFGASIACVMAPTIEVLIAARFLQAVGGCSGQVITRAIVRDAYGRDRAGSVLAKIAAAMGFAPLIGPVIGGYLTDVFGWQSCFLVLSAAGGMALIGVTVLLPETNYDRNPDATRPGPMVRAMAGMYGSRVFLGYVLAASASYCGLFAFISGSSFVFVQVLGLQPSDYGYCFAAAVGGFIVGARIAARMNDDVAAVRLGALVNVVFGLAMLGFLLVGIQTVWTVLIPMVFYTAGMGILLPHAQAGAIGPYPRHAGTASALFGTTQYATAAAAGLWVGHGFDGSALPMALAVAVSGVFTIACYVTLVRRS